MARGFARFVDWLWRPAQADRSQCRLTESQALEIAARTISASPLSVLRVTRSAQRLVWVIGTATIGRGQYVRVDDDAGEVIDSGTWGKR